MASGHTSRNHEVFVHQLVPEAHVFNKLIGHPRTPWCLTFDPSCAFILYSGCLGGVVRKWNVKVCFITLALKHA
jgi:activator-of-BECN1-regulated-autophagy protein 1